MAVHVVHVGVDWAKNQLFCVESCMDVPSAFYTYFGENVN